MPDDVSARLLAAIVESSDDAIIGKTLDGIITSWNKGAERTYGYTEEEAIGRPISMLVPPDAPDEIPRILAQLKRGERIQSYETKRVTKHGRTIDISLTVSPILDPDGNVVGASAIARDITHQKLAEIAERRTQELEVANEVLRDFIAMASHDLRTPLTVIQGFASTLTENWDSLPDDDKRNYLERITRQSKNLGAIVNDLMLIVRIQAKAVQPEARPVNVRDVITEVVDDLREHLPEVRLDFDDGPTALVDPAHLQRILHNLLQNASRYGRPPVSVEASSVDSTVELRVCDEGPGVPEEFVPALFERFVRADKELSRSKGGTGLGLAIVRGLAEANGGEVWYEPNHPSGAVFKVRLAAAEPGAEG